MEELMARYMAGDLSEKERGSFEAELATDKTVAQEFEAYLNLWQLTHDSANTISFDTDSAWNNVEGQISKETKVVAMEPKKSFSFVKIAATLLILAVSSYLIFTSVSESSSDEMIEVLSLQELKEITLPDGSVVKMNANSKLTYSKDFNKSTRKVVLVGEADFDVVRNERVPFLVEAGASTIKVLGTNFDVVAYPNSTVKLNVTEGKVAFAAKENSEVMKIVEGGQKATLSSDEIEVTEIKNLNYSGWWTRSFSFEGTKLKDVVEDLEKAYWVEIELSEEIEDCPLNTTFKDNSIDEIVDIITASFAEQGMTSSKTEENKIKLSGKSCN